MTWNCWKTGTVLNLLEKWNCFKLIVDLFGFMHACLKVCIVYLNFISTFWSLYNCFVIMYCYYICTTLDEMTIFRVKKT